MALQLFIFLLILSSVIRAELPEQPLYTEEYQRLINNPARGEQDTSNIPEQINSQLKSAKNKVSTDNVVVDNRNKQFIVDQKKPQPGPGLKRKNRIIQVGYGREFRLPSMAAKFAINGDTIEIYDSGVYIGDEAIWSQDNIKIKGVGGRPHIKGRGLIKNGKALWVISGNNVVVENIEFSNARVKDRNGAAIRSSGKYLKIKNCYIHHNENGILTGAGKDTKIEIEGSEFSFNGYGRGRTHNIYIGNVALFSLRNSYIHHALVGHNVKTRAKKNIILYNKIIDGKTGKSSYAIDLANGGEAYLIGNIIQQGKSTENSTIISYAAEGFQYSNNLLYLVNNTLVNDRSNGIFVNSRKGSNVELINNIFYGKGKVCKGPCEGKANFITRNKNIFVDASLFDYRPRKVVSIIDKGVNPGVVNGFDLTPAYQYVRALKKETRVLKNKIDIGAYEYNSSYQ